MIATEWYRVLVWPNLTKFGPRTPLLSVVQGCLRTSFEHLVLSHNYSLLDVLNSRGGWYETSVSFELWSTDSDTNICGGFKKKFWWGLKNNIYILTKKIYALFFSPIYYKLLQNTQT
jgi:hypothetical protein